MATNNPTGGDNAQMASDDSHPPTPTGAKIPSSQHQPLTPYHPFPPVMNLYSNYPSLSNLSRILDSLKTLKLCGANEKEFLYIVEVTSGTFTSNANPLGARPGLCLHNGISIKDPILATAGDTSQHAITTLDRKSVILLPSTGFGHGEEGMVEEDLIAVAGKGAAGEGGGRVAFQFEVEIGTGEGEKQRERFEWQKGCDLNGGKAKGFRLVRLSRVGDAAGTGLGPSSTAKGDEGGHDRAVVAELVFAKITSLKHALTLEFKGVGRSGELGEGWTLMVVVTALRLFALRASGRTTKMSTRVRG